MAPRNCLGFVANAEGEAADPCVFNGNGTGRPARALAHGRCAWCCPEEMARRLASPKLEQFLVYTLVNFKSAKEVFKKATGRLPEDRRAHILAEVDARLEREEDDAEMAPAPEEEVEEDEAEAPGSEKGAELGIFPDNPNNESEGEEGQLDIDAVDVGKVDFGDALNAFEPLEAAEEDVEMAEEESKANEEAEEAAPKKRRLRGKQAAPIYGPPSPLPAFAAVAEAALGGRAGRRRRARRRVTSARAEQERPARGPPRAWASPPRSTPSGGKRIASSAATNSWTKSSTNSGAASS